MYIQYTYHKGASSNTSHLEAHAGFFRLLMKGILDPCTVTFRQKVDFLISNAHQNSRLYGQLQKLVCNFKNTLNSMWGHSMSKMLKIEFIDAFSEWHVVACLCQRLHDNTIFTLLDKTFYQSILIYGQNFFSFVPN